MHIVMKNTRIYTRFYLGNRRKAPGDGSIMPISNFNNGNNFAASLLVSYHNRKNSMIELACFLVLFFFFLEKLHDCLLLVLSLREKASQSLSLYDEVIDKASAWPEPMSRAVGFYATYLISPFWPPRPGMPVTLVGALKWKISF